MDKQDLINSIIKDYSGDISAAIVAYHCVQYNKLEGMEQDKMLTALTSEKCDGPNNIIAYATMIVCDWFDRENEPFYMSVSPSDVDLYIMGFCNMCDHIQKEFELGEDSYKYVIALIASTFTLKYQQYTFEEIIDFVRKEEYPVCSYDVTESYKILRGYGFEISDIGLFLSETKDKLPDKGDDEYIDMMLDANETMDNLWKVFPKALALFKSALSTQDYNDILSFVKEKEEDAKAVWSLSFMLIAMIPTHADPHKCIEDLESTAQLLDLFGGKKTNEYLNSKYRNGLLHLFRIGFTLQLHASEEGDSILADQGAAYNFD